MPRADEPQGEAGDAPFTSDAGILALPVGLPPLRGPLSAHPHVWVTVETTVLYEGGQVTGFGTSGPSTTCTRPWPSRGSTRTRTATIRARSWPSSRKVNIDGLKEFDYFTHVKLGDKDVKAKEPIDY